MILLKCRFNSLMTNREIFTIHAGFNFNKERLLMKCHYRNMTMQYQLFCMAFMNQFI